ncbi:MAG: hypothetical protein U0794_18495 [Isosphaeraceae bacterium]
MLVSKMNPKNEVLPPSDRSINGFWVTSGARDVPFDVAGLNVRRDPPS